MTFAEWTIKALEIIAGSTPIALMVIAVSLGLGIMVVNRTWAQNGITIKQLDIEEKRATNKLVTKIDRQAPGGDFSA